MFTNSLNNGNIIEQRNEPNLSFTTNDNNVNGNTSENGVNFAPSFLFGPPNQGLKRRFFAPHLNSTGSGFSPGILKSKESNMSPGTKSVHWSPLLTREHVNSSPLKKEIERKDSFKNLSSNSLWNGPPLRSLNDEPPIPKQPKLNTSLFTNSNNCFNASVVSSRELESESNENNINNDNEREQDFWVTVFGFPATQITLILEHFSKHGNIVAHNIPKTGNWVHIRYSSKIHVNQALARNGQIFNGIMLGVVRCKNLEVINDEFNANNPTFTAPSNPTSSNSQANISLNGNNSNTCLNNISAAENKSDFYIDGVRMVPSLSDKNSSKNYSNGARHSRLSTLSRAGMRPLNCSNYTGDQTLNNSAIDDQNKTHDNSILEKFWNYISQL